LVEQDAGEFFRLFLGGACTENDNLIGHPKKFQSKSGKQCYYYVPGPHYMKAPLTRSVYVMAFFVVISYAFFTLRGPKGIPGLLERQRQVQETEKRNTALAREIEQKREHIKRLADSPAEQEKEIRQRLKLVHPGEKVYIVGEPEKK
jgi:cell division protein FtsB